MYESRHNSKPLVDTAERERLYPLDAPEHYVGRRRAYEVRWYDRVNPVWILGVAAVAALMYVIAMLNAMLGNGEPVVELIIPMPAPEK